MKILLFSGLYDLICGSYAEIKAIIPAPPIRKLINGASNLPSEKWDARIYTLYQVGS